MNIRMHCRINLSGRELIQKIQCKISLFVRIRSTQRAPNWLKINRNRHTTHSRHCLVFITLKKSLGIATYTRGQYIPNSIPPCKKQEKLLGNFEKMAKNGRFFQKKWALGLYFIFFLLVLLVSREPIEPQSWDWSRFKAETIIIQMGPTAALQLNSFRSSNQ